MIFFYKILKILYISIDWTNFFSLFLHFFQVKEIQVRCVYEQKSTKIFPYESFLFSWTDIKSCCVTERIRRYILYKIISTVCVEVRSEVRSTWWHLLWKEREIHGMFSYLCWSFSSSRILLIAATSCSSVVLLYFQVTYIFLYVSTSNVYFLSSIIIIIIW